MSQVVEIGQACLFGLLVEIQIALMVRILAKKRIDFRLAEVVGKVEVFPQAEIMVEVTIEVVIVVLETARLEGAP